MPSKNSVSKTIVIEHYKKLGCVMDAYGNLKTKIGANEYRVKIQDISFRVERAVRDSNGKMITWKHVGGGYYSNFEIINGELKKIKKDKPVKSTTVKRKRELTPEGKVNQSLIMINQVQLFGALAAQVMEKYADMNRLITMSDKERAKIHLKDDDVKEIYHEMRNSIEPTMKTEEEREMLDIIKQMSSTKKIKTWADLVKVYEKIRDISVKYSESSIPGKG